MASTISTATLQVQILEDIELNGVKRGSRAYHTFANIKQIDERILTVPPYEVDILLLSSSAAAGTYATNSFKYARLTNLDDTNYVSITLLSGSQGSKSVQKLLPKTSMMITDLALSGSSAGVSFGSFNDITAVKASANSANVDLSLFVATT
jgi:hypothetical protein